MSDSAPVPDKRIDTLLVYANTGSDGLVAAAMWKSELRSLMLEVRAARMMRQIAERQKT